MANPSGNLLAGRYRVIRRLGSGGMATVLLAEDQRLSRQVAVKRMHAESPAATAKRFRREAHLGASLNHPNVVSIFDIEADEENVLIVMEYVSGGTMKDAMARGPLPLDAALKLLNGVAAALDHAHLNGVVHRDVKPANVLLDGDGRAKLADLGIATAAEVTHITATGTVLGTAAYMAPERLEGHAGGPEVDVYAFATLAYEALTGHKARQGRSAVEIARAVMGEPPPDLRIHMPDAPQAAADVLARGMSRDPAERPASAGDLMRELSAAFEGEPTGPTAALPGAGVVASAPRAHAAAAQRSGAGAPPNPPPGPEEPQRSPGPRRWLAPAVAAAALLIAIGAVLALAGGNDGKSGGGSKSTTGQSAQTTTGTTQPAPSPPATTAQSPEGAVKSFYELAARKDYQAAWKLAGPGLQAQLGGYDSFVNTVDTLEKIEFPKLQTTSRSGDSATVAFDSVATHTNHVDRCTGTIDLSASGGEWRIEQIHPACDQQPRGGAPPSATPGKGPGGGRPITPDGKKPKNQSYWGNGNGDGQNGNGEGD